MKALHAVVILLSLLFASSIAAQNAPRPILVLYAFDEEGVTLSQQMTIAETDSVLGRQVFSGALAGKDIVLAETGVGMTNAAMTTQALIDRYHPRIVILSGIAGAIDTSVKVGDICVPARWSEHDYGYIGANGFELKGVWAMDLKADSSVRFAYFTVDSSLLNEVRHLDQDSLPFELIGDRRPKLIVGGMGVTGNQFIDSKEKREWLSQTLHADVTDMESAAVVQVCAVNALPCLIFRSASDLAGGSGSATARSELNQFFKTAAKNAATVVVGFLEELGSGE